MVESCFLITIVWLKWMLQIVTGLSSYPFAHGVVHSKSLYYFQVTILVAAEGVHKLPSINGSGDLKEALQKLGSIPSSRTLVRIFWKIMKVWGCFVHNMLLFDFFIAKLTSSSDLEWKKPKGTLTIKDEQNTTTFQISVHEQERRKVVIFQLINFSTFWFKLKFLRSQQTGSST